MLAPRLRLVVVGALLQSTGASTMPSLPLPTVEKAVTRFGAATVEIPIPSPPGTAGFQPDLRIRYSSQAGDGPFGVGWSLNLGEVRRSTRFGMPDLSDGTTTQFEIDGRLLTASTTQGSTRHYYPDVADFSRVLASISAGRIQSWEVTSPRGFKSLYGTTTSSKVQNGPATTRWLLSELRDPNGNGIRVAYDTTDPGNPVPSVVGYTYRGSSLVGGSASLKEIVFHYDARLDVSEQFLAGVRTISTQRVAAIDVRVGGTVLRRLEFDYLGFGAGAYSTERSRLSVVRSCASTCASALPEATYLLEDPNDLSGSFWFEPAAQVFVSRRRNEPKNHSLSRTMGPPYPGLTL